MKSTREICSRRPGFGWRGRRTGAAELPAPKSKAILNPTSLAGKFEGTVGGNTGFDNPKTFIWNHLISSNAPKDTQLFVTPFREDTGPFLDYCTPDCWISLGALMIYRNWRARVTMRLPDLPVSHDYQINLRSIMIPWVCPSWQLSILTCVYS